MTSQDPNLYLEKKIYIHKLLSHIKYLGNGLDSMENQFTLHARHWRKTIYKIEENQTLVNQDKRE